MLVPNDQHIIVMLGVHRGNSHRENARALKKSLRHAQNLMYILVGNGFVYKTKTQKYDEVPWRLTAKGIKYLVRENLIQDDCE